MSKKSISANHGILSPVLSPRVLVNSYGEKRDEIAGSSKVFRQLEHTVNWETVQSGTEQSHEMYKEPAPRRVVKFEQQQSPSQLK